MEVATVEPEPSGTQREGTRARRLHAAQIVFDHVRAGFKPESDIEVRASMVVSAAEPMVELADDVEPSVAAEEVSTRVEDGLGWRPAPIGRCLPPATLDQMRPKPFFALTGRRPKPGETQVPRGKDDITPAWLTAVLRERKYLSAEEAVLEIDVKPLGAGEGEFSELVAVQIAKVEGECTQLTRHLVAKFSPPTMSSIELTTVFGTEAHFYNDMSIEAGALVRPDALYVGYQRNRRGKDNYCILIENACPPDSGTMAFKRVTGCSSLDHMLLVMRALARFHARWWGISRSDTTRHAKAISFVAHPLKGGGPLPPLPQVLTRTVWVMILKNGLKALPHCFSNRPEFAGTPKFAEAVRASPVPPPPPPSLPPHLPPSPRRSPRHAPPRSTPNSWPRYDRSSGGGGWR